MATRETAASSRLPSCILDVWPKSKAQEFGRLRQQQPQQPPPPPPLAFLLLRHGTSPRSMPKETMWPSRCTNCRWKPSKACGRWLVFTSCMVISAELFTYITSWKICWCLRYSLKYRKNKQLRKVVDLRFFWFMHWVVQKKISPVVRGKKEWPKKWGKFLGSKFNSCDEITRFHQDGKRCNKLILHINLMFVDDKTWNNHRLIRLVLQLSMEALQLETSCLLEVETVANLHNWPF